VKKGYNDQTHKLAEVIKEDLNPDWGDTAVYNITGVGKEDLDTISIEIILRDHNRMG
jgi:hypothetical protein